MIAHRERFVTEPAAGLSSPFQPSAASTPALERVTVERLTLTDFRSYRLLRIDVDARPVVLTGPNGAGKTNLLEALSFFAPGRGLRGAKLNAVGYAPVQDGDSDLKGQSWSVAATLKTSDGAIDIGTGFNAGSARRLVHINGEAARGAGTFAQHFGLVWLTPAMDRLFMDGPGVRRRFIDQLVNTLDAGHAGRTSAYDHAYRQRLRLLRDGVGDESWFTALEDTMARHGVALAAARHDFVEQLNRKLAVAPSLFPAAHLTLQGSVDRWLEQMPAVDVEDALRHSLMAERAEGHDTVTGPHRSDISVVMISPGHASHGQLAAVCSTGEQKALLVSLMLAHARLQKELRGHVPILLLDEITAHFDPDRRAALFDEILKLGTQAWMTGTDISLFTGLGDHAQFLTVQNEALVPSTLSN